MARPVAVCSSPRCAQALFSPAERCPACGRPTWSARRVAVLGGLLLLLGLMLAGGMAVLVYLLAPSALNPGVETGAGRMRFTGTAAQGRLLLWLLALIGFFGAFCMANGAWQLATGRRSRAMLMGMLVLVAAIFFSVWWLIPDMAAPHRLRLR